MDGIYIKDIGYISYSDIKLRRKETMKILEDVKYNKGYKEIECTCNKEGKKVQMDIVKLSDERGYTVRSKRNQKKNHNENCQFFTLNDTLNEIRPENPKKEIDVFLKGFVYNRTKEPELSSTSIRNGKSNKKRYNHMYGVGEWLLTEGNNRLCDINKRIPNQESVFNFIFKQFSYYNREDINSPMELFKNKVKITKNSKKNGVDGLDEITFKPFYLYNSKYEDGTDRLKRFILNINKDKINNYSDENKGINMTTAYILLKYISHEAYNDDLYKIRLDVNMKSQKGEAKYIEVLINKSIFEDAFDKRSDNLKKLDSVDIIMSAMVKLEQFTEDDINCNFKYYKDMNVYVFDNPAFITVYKDTTIPIESLNEHNVVKEFIVQKGRFIIKRIAHFDCEKTKLFNDYIPDFLVTEKTTEKTYILEVFGFTDKEYMVRMVDKVRFYMENERILELKYGFIRYFDNILKLGEENKIEIKDKEKFWLRPNIKYLKNREWKYKVNLIRNIEYKVNKILNNENIDL